MRLRALRPAGFRLFVLFACLAARAAAGEPRIVISEIHYHPSPQQGAAEFIEIHNAGTEIADLSGWKFTRGIRFTFPPGTRLEASAACVVCQDVPSFRKAFGEGARLAGAFQGRLGNEGNLVRLSDASGAAVSDLEYGELPPWPKEAGGQGSSLTRLHPGVDADDPTGWTAAAPSPGSVRWAAVPPRALSLYRPRLEPREPRAGESVKVSISARGSGGSGGPGGPGAPVRALLRYSAGGRERSINLAAAVAKGREVGSDEQTLTAELPPQPAFTVVRYWFEASAGGEAVRSPPAGAPTPRYGYYVQGPKVETKLPLYEMILDPRALQALESNPYSNQLYPAVLAVGADVFEARVRYRGAWARTWPKKAWKIILAQDRKLHGRRRLNLNSGWRDPAFIREPLAYDLYREAGSLSLRSRPIRLHLNGQFYGLYIEVEQPKSGWLADQGMPGGLLLKAGSRVNAADERAFESQEELEQHYSLEAGPATGYQELLQFCRELEDAGDPAAFLESRLDVDKYIAYIATSAFVQNWDGYNKNHFVACDLRGGKKWYAVPWDLDRTLGDHWDMEFDVATQSLLLGTQRFPGTTGWNRLLERFLSQPRLLKRYHERLLSLLNTTFTEEKIWPKLEALREAIAPEAEMDRRRWGGDADWRRGIDQLKKYVTDRRNYLLSELPGGEPAAPRALKPAAGAAVAGDPVVLETGEFQHADSKVTHRKTRWEVRADGSSWFTPAVDLCSSKDLVKLALPRGVLQPRTTYRWRVSHLGSNGKLSPPSEESSFTTPDFPFKAVPFDLSRRFNTDLVASPGGGPSNDSVDDLGGVYCEDGFDGQRSGNPRAQGLPKDRAVGVHVLGDYGRRNVLQIVDGDGDRHLLKVVPGRYRYLRFLVAGGAGDSEMPVDLHYSDGSIGTGSIPCDDWYDDNPPDGPLESVRNGAVPLLNNLDRLRRGAFKDRNEPALFEATVSADPDKTLEAIALLADRATFEKAGRTRFNLFAVTGIALSR